MLQTNNIVRSKIVQCVTYVLIYGFNEALTIGRKNKVAVRCKKSGSSPVLIIASQSAIGRLSRGLLENNYACNKLRHIYMQIDVRACVHGKKDRKSPD